MPASLQCFKNALAYFAMAVSYTHKMFIKLATGDINLKNLSEQLMEQASK